MYRVEPSLGSMALLLERSYTGERTYTRLKHLVSHIVPAGQRE